MFSGSSIFQQTSQAPGIFGSTAASAGIFNSPSTGLFGSTGNTSQPLGGTSLFGSANPVGGQQVGMGTVFPQGLGTGMAGLGNQGKKGTVGMRLGTVKDNDGSVFTNIMASKEIIGIDKSLEELRWEDYQLKKAGQVGFNKNQTAGIIGTTGTSLFAPAASPQPTSGLFSNASTSSASASGGLFSSGTGLFASNSTSSPLLGLGTGLAATSQATNTGLFGNPASTSQPASLLSTTPNTNTGIFGGNTGTGLFGGNPNGSLFSNNAAGSPNTLTANTSGTLFGSAAASSANTFQNTNISNPITNTITPSFSSMQPFAAESSSLLAPVQPDNSDPYAIKSYFTGKKELEQSILKQQSLVTPYDNTGELLRRDNNYIRSEWKYKGAQPKEAGLWDEEGSSIARRLQSTKETIAHSVEQLGKLRISGGGRSESSAVWSLEDEVVCVSVASVVRKKKLRMRLEMHRSRLVDELKEAALARINKKLKLNIDPESCKLVKEGRKLEDGDTIEAAGIASRDELELVVCHNPSNESRRLTKQSTISLASEQSRSRKFTEESKEPLQADTSIPKETDKREEVAEDEPMKKPASSELIPKLNRKNYAVTPSLATLSAMDENELEAVHDFTIENEHGKIIFEGMTNVKGLDLDEIVAIEKKQVFVYPEGSAVPPIGNGLNRPATIHLYRCFPTNKPKEDVQKKLEKVARKQGAVHVDYDEEQGTWIFRVNHF